MKARRGTLVLDFDGVLNSYVTKWEAADVIPDPPVEGAQAFCREMIAEGYQLVISSTRCNTQAGRGAIASWLVKHGFPLAVGIAEGKPTGRVMLDDRGLRFEGVWPTVEQIEDAAVPWNKRKEG